MMKYGGRRMPAEVSAYTPSFDQESYKLAVDNVDVVFEEEKKRLDSYTDKQLQTLLSERYNVLTSTFTYEMRDGQLWGEDMAEPALDSFKRGRDYRKKHGNPIDFEREDAEIVGFAKVQEMLSHGREVLSVSIQGGEESTYQHNFYDVFRVRGEKIEARRYSSALNIDDYNQKFGLDFVDPSEFLANPINISDQFESADDVHRVLHRDHDFMDQDFFKEHILTTTAPYRQGYIRALAEGNVYLQRLYFNAMMNIADEVSDQYKNIDKEPYHKLILDSTDNLIYYGNQEVRKVQAGCGSSGGFGSERIGSSGVNSPFSVNEFGENEEGFKCPNCGHEPEGPIGNQCPSCKITKEEYAKKSSKPSC